MQNKQLTHTPPLKNFVFRVLIILIMLAAFLLTLGLLMRCEVNPALRPGLRVVKL